MIGKLSRIAAASFSALLAAAAAAQDAEKTEEPRRESGEEIVVTGSRLRRKDLTSEAPLTVITREQFESSGRISIGDFLQTMPWQGNALNTQVNNGGDGSVRINLRGLGDQRTLVLINGRRMVPVNDLSTMPSAVVDHIEVLLDGASAVYGSDAEGGVVNIITRKRFSGTEASAYYGQSGYGDGAIIDVSATTGQAGDRGSVLFSAGYYQQQATWAGNRDYTRYGLAYNANTDEVTRIGSPNPPSGRFDFTPKQVTPPGPGMPVPGSALLNHLVSSFPGATQFVFCLPTDTSPECIVGNGYRPYKGVSLTDDGYNFQPENYNRTPSQRISLFSTGDLSLGSRARAFYEAAFVNRQSEQRLAPEPLNTAGLVVSKDNAYNPFGVDVTHVALRLANFPPRGFAQDIDSFRVVAGLEGTTPEGLGPASGLFWNASLLYGRSENAGYTDGMYRTPKVQAAIGPTYQDSSHKLHCGVDKDHEVPGCVPLDLFHGAYSLTSDQIESLGYSGVYRDIFQTTGVQANFSAELFRLFSDRPAALGGGYEYRFYYGNYTPDPIAQADESSDDSSKITRGGYHVNEGYLELSLPIVSDVPLAEVLEVSAAARAFNYSNFGSAATYKLGARWKPVRDVTLRGTWSTAFRAPQISDLYAGRASNFLLSPDPCAAVDPSSPRGKACSPAAGNGDDFDFHPVTFGGNSQLQPEKGKIFTAGLILEPRFAKGFSVTADYFHYTISNAIQNFINPNAILELCYPEKADVAPSYCERVKRDPVTQQIIDISSIGDNIGGIRTDGIDLALRYAFGTSAGRFTFAFDGVWLHRYDFDLPGGTVIHARGTYDAAQQFIGGVYPAFKFNAGMHWTLGGFDAAVNTQLIGSYHECGDATGDNTGIPGTFTNLKNYCYLNPNLKRTVSPWNSWDISASYAFNTPIGKTTFAAGVNNLFNQAPPVIYSSFTPQSDPEAYDFVGHFVYGRIIQRF